MLLFGKLAVWVGLIALLASTVCYLMAGRKSALARAGRGLFFVVLASILAAAGTLGTMLVTHRFDSEYVFEHSARAMDPLYWFPSMWAGQEGSFLLWAFWMSIVGAALSVTSGPSERRVMPVFNVTLLFIVSLLAIRSPFLPLDTHGLPVPTEGLGLNPNLENPWMVIHPPTLFLGFATLTVPFAFAVQAMIWRDWDNWLKRALPWGLLAFSVMGLAMMMGGYWAYEMLGWGGFWAWDPVENGPFVPWMFLLGFVHAAQINRIRGGLGKTTLLMAILPYVTALYETYLTRSGELDKFSVHSFSTLGGAANSILLYGLLAALAVGVGLLVWRARRVPSSPGKWDQPNSREFAFLMSIVLFTLCAIISGVGMSAPLITRIANLHDPSIHLASVHEDFYNKANFPVALLIAIGLGLGPHLAWRERGKANSDLLMWAYGGAVVLAVGFMLLSRTLGTPLFGFHLAVQVLLFTTSAFALIANAILLRQIRPAGQKRIQVWTVGGAVSHIGAAVLLIGIVCLATFVHKDPNVLLIQGKAQSVLDGRYTMTYLGQTSDFTKDKNNALKFQVVSKDKKENFVALMPFAMRAIQGGEKKLFGHPAIVHHTAGDLYVSLKDGPDLFYKTPLFQPKVKLGGVSRVGDYTIKFVKFERDPAAAAFVQQTGQMPEVFPVNGVVEVTYKGKTTTYSPQNIRYRDNPAMPDSPELKLPGGWLLSFQGMNAGSADAANPNAGSMEEAGSFGLRADSGPPTEAFQLEVSTRPMINLVWIGTMLLVIGGLVSMRRRIAEARVAAAEPDTEPVTAEKTPARRTRTKRQAARVR
ncbi:MAG: cytochrome c-type biogenesis CcmF C-terminal domain-containing protein [Capsulimonas sp.]|uniref:cytochrome c-type biogenesis CcmF C-terminal domain-containing protein n=1 Tax=Capsulimonas sp. TaxID=2494211 RepID=UPI0032634345